jgi:phosphate transport system substrate-binding protein
MPYQRNEASGSQTLFISLLMKGEPPAPAPSEFIFADMSSIIDAISYEDYGLGGLGFSVYFYASLMHEHADRIHFLEVDGVAPTNESIASGEYPLYTYYYAIIRKDTPKRHPVRKLIDFVLSDEGQNLMQETGYVPLQMTEAR